MQCANIVSGHSFCSVFTPKFVLLCVFFPHVSVYHPFTSHDDMIGGVAQWLGRRSVAGGLSLIYA